jgi:hypothetical protein
MRHCLVGVRNQKLYSAKIRSGRRAKAGKLAAPLKPKFTPTLMLACDPFFLAQLGLNSMLARDVPGVPRGERPAYRSSFAPFSEDISNGRATVRLCSGLHTRAYGDYNSIFRESCA